MILSFAWRNLWRQPIRTSLSFLGMALTSMLLVFMLSFQFGSYDTIKSSMLRINDGYGQFQAPGYKNDPETSKVLTNPAALLTAARALPGVTAAAPRDMGYVLLANGARTFAAAVTGIDPVNEAKITTLSGLVQQGRRLKATDDAAIELGEGLARNLHLGIGDKVTMLGSGMDGSVAADVLTVVGIFKSSVPEIDRQIALMPIKRFDATFLMNGAVNVIALSGKALSDIVAEGPALRRIATKYNVDYLNWSEIQPALQQAINLDLSTSILMYSTLVIVVVFIILNTLYMSVFERTREFGMLMAIGMQPGQIGRMVWVETIFLSVIGNGLGIALGIAVTYYFQRVGIAFQGMDAIYAQWGLPPRMYPVMTLFRVLIGPGTIMAAIAVLGVIPYRRILGLKPVSAMAA